MTDIHLSLWAQALDNVSPDHITLRGEHILPGDSLRRQEVATLVASVIKNGRLLFDSSGVKLTADSHSFVLEIPSSERDQAGRIAPIVCHGSFDFSAPDTIASVVISELNTFANLIGRELSNAHHTQIVEAFTSLKKKYWRAKIVRLSVVAIILTSLLLLLLRHFQSTGTS